VTRKHHRRTRPKRQTKGRGTEVVGTARAHGMGRDRSRLRVGLVAVGVLALVVRIIYLLEIRHNPFFGSPVVDAWDYHADALGLVQTGNSMGTHAFFQAPLTTYFLAGIYKVFGTNLLWPRVVQIVLGTLTAMGTFVLGRQLFGRRAAWIAGIVTALYPLLLFYEGELLAPAITVFLDVAVLLLVFTVVMPRSGWLWSAPGFVFGVRALATTNNLATVPVFWVWMALRGRSLGWPGRKVGLAVLAFSVGIIAAVAPVTIRNWNLQRQFVLISSNAGLNFYLGNSGDYGAKIGMRPGADWDEFVNEHVRKGLKVGPQMSGYFFEEARTYMRSHPGEYLRLLLHKVRLFLSGDEILRNQEIYPFRRYSTVLKVLLWKVHVPGGPGLAFPFGLLLPLAWPGCVLAFSRRHPGGLLLVAYAAFYSLSVIAFFVTARYRVPVVIPLILLVSYGWAAWRAWWRPLRSRVIAILGIVGLGLLSNWNVGATPKDMNADAYYSLAVTLKHQGDLEGAEAHYKEALRLNPMDASAWVNLGLDIYEARGMLDEAESSYRRALEVRPGYATAVFNLGQLAEKRRRPAQAESLYYEAARLDPLMTAPYINLATMAVVRKDYETAMVFYNEAHMRNPEDPKALIGLGITAFETEGLEPALAYFEEARTRDPANADVYYNLALVYARTNQPECSAEAARKAAELNPKDNGAYIIYADQMKLMGRSEEARQFLHEAVRRRPDVPGPHQALRRLGP
jgi:tetratricopeptide (TPR) repeat protein